VLRLVGDTVFLAGVASLAWFVIGLRTGWSYQPSISSKEAERFGDLSKGAPLGA
jgi:hypothetical protein